MTDKYIHPDSLVGMRERLRQQAERIEWLKKAIERFYGENALPDMERWIKNEQKGQDNEQD